MLSLRSKSRISVFLTMLLVAWTVIGGVVMAAEEGGTSSEKAAAAAKGPVWAMAYIVVLLLVGLGVIATIRGSKRRDKARPDDMEVSG